MGLWFGVSAYGVGNGICCVVSAYGVCYRNMVWVSTYFVGYRHMAVLVVPCHHNMARPQFAD